ncbi:hypothetical protein [Bacteroides mediterraneensis]|uniref:hypothetical protein n=1 Tax=Bacteroides mediterraneensis TaxID=1841856 RepID=UPI00195CC498|nr:hypothetical protein [Bacteroides mediterraneensis]MBM6781464.1 hypothetical protein [Bacteroides mediterraneensis]
MRTIYVHPSVMKRIKSGNLSPITTRYEVDVGDIVEVMDDDEVNSVITKVKRVRKVAVGLYQIELDDPATAFIE